MNDPAPEVLTKRRATLTAALGFALLEPRTRELELLHGWLDERDGALGDQRDSAQRRRYVSIETPPQ